MNAFTLTPLGYTENSNTSGPVNYPQQSTSVLKSDSYNQMIVRKIIYDNPMVDIYYPSQFYSEENFNIIHMLILSYAKLLGCSMTLRLTGYDDKYNYRLESEPICINNQYKKFIFTMNNGLPNVISD